MKKFVCPLLLIAGIFFSAMSFADQGQSLPLKQQFLYAGLIGGYGNDDWSSMVVSYNNVADIATYNSNPAGVDGKGALFGLNAGYQFNAHVAVEAEYVKMPTANVSMKYFGSASLERNISSQLSYAAITLKLMAPIFNSNFTFFAEAGPAYEWRKDSASWDLLDEYPAVSVGTWAPLFGGGFMYRMDQHWQSELAFQYLPGTGKSVGDPMNYYIPEIYAGQFKLDYIF